jgi:hypothetical protein
MLRQPGIQVVFSRKNNGEDGIILDEVVIQGRMASGRSRGWVTRRVGGRWAESERPRFHQAGELSARCFNPQELTNSDNRHEDYEFARRLRRSAAVLCKR